MYLTRSSPTKSSAPEKRNDSGSDSQAPVSAFEVDLPKVSDPQVAEAIEDLLAAWDRTPTFYAMVKTFIADGAGNKGQTKGKGQYALEKKDGKVRIRFELKNGIEIHTDSTDGSFLGTAEHLIWIYDGDYLYRFINQPKFQKAVKKHIDYSEVQQLGGRLLFRELIENNNLSLLPEEMVDGRAARVILAKPKDGAWQTTYHFDKSTGLQLKKEERNPDGETNLSITLSDIDTAFTPDAETWVFVVPENVSFVDETAQGP